MFRNEWVVSEWRRAGPSPGRSIHEYGETKEDAQALGARWNERQHRLRCNDWPRHSFESNRQRLVHLVIGEVLLGARSKPGAQAKQPLVLLLTIESVRHEPTCDRNQRDER